MEKEAAKSALYKVLLKAIDDWEVEQEKVEKVFTTDVDISSISDAFQSQLLQRIDYFVSLLYRLSFGMEGEIAGWCLSCSGKDHHYITEFAIDPSMNIGEVAAAITNNLILKSVDVIKQAEEMVKGDSDDER